MGWDKTSNYYSGQGVVLLGDRDVVTGKGFNFLPLGNVSDLKITVATSVIEHKESQSGARGIDLRLTTEVKAGISLTLEDFNPANLAIALRGDNTTVIAGTVTGEVGKVAKGFVMPLARLGVSVVVVKKGTATLIPFNPITPTAAYDYKVNLEAGSIQWATTSATTGLLTGDSVLTDYAYAAQETVSALTTGATEKYLRFEGLNTANGNKAVVVEVFRFLTDPLKELPLISDAIQQFVLDGSALADGLQTGSKYFKQSLLS